MDFDEKLLRKKAKGFHYKETVDEYAESEGELRLVKRKISTKYVPPDVAAIKAVSETTERLDSMTDAQLLELREKLLKERKVKNEIGSDKV